MYDSYFQSTSFLTSQILICSFSGGSLAVSLILYFGKCNPIVAVFIPMPGTNTVPNDIGRHEKLIYFDIVMFISLHNETGRKPLL